MSALHENIAVNFDSTRSIDLILICVDQHLSAVK